MKTKNIILIALLAILAVLASCKKDHDIPTGKVFNGGEVLTDSVVDYEKLLVGTWGVEKIEYYNLDYAGNPILSSLKTINLDPSSTDNGIQMIFREDKTGEIRDSSIDTLWVEESSYIVCPDTILVKAFTYYYDKSDSLLNVSMTNSLVPHKMDVKELTNNTFVYENEYSTNYMEKAYLKRLSDEPLPPMESYTVNVSANPSNGGVVTGGGTYQQGQSCTVTAIANDGYSFNNWTENDNVVSSDANYTFTITGSRTLVAHFSANSQNYTISVSANPSNGGMVSGGGNYQEGQSCTVTAIANDGYSFNNWTENDNVVSSDANYTFTITGSRTLVAHFSANSQNYTISVSANPSNGGTVSGGGNYQEGQSCTVTATANSNYTFTNWTENGSVVSTQANYIFTVNGNRTLMANFNYNGGGTHEYVDLGLPSGLLWATCNIGADSPEDYGDYFAWGETRPKDTYNWTTYQYCMGSSNTLTKYCNDASYGYNGFTDNLTVLEASDDAATAQWGNGWRMPTQAECQELLNNTTNIWTTQNGVNGRLFTATNGNSLFLPAAGYRRGSSLYDAGTYGFYWSSSLYTVYPGGAWYLYFHSSDCYMDYFNRYYGFTVRPVRSSRQN